MSLSKSKVAISVVSLIIFLSVLHASDDNGNGIDDLVEDDFATMYAPILHYHQNNPLFPMPVEAVYTEEDFQNATDGYVPLPVPDNDHSPEEWQTYFESVLLPQSITPQVYYNIITQDIEPDITYTVIQYWFYYPFNDASNLHEGDWEHVAVLVEGSTPGASIPAGAVFHHHFQLERIDWSRLEKTGNHIHIYIGGHTRTEAGLLKYTREQDCPSIGGYQEITGGSFYRPGTHDKAWYKKIGLGAYVPVGHLEADETIIPDRTLWNTDYTLVNLRDNGNPDLWWKDYDVKFGVPAVELQNNTCNKSLELPGITANFRYPMPTDPPRSPYYSNTDPQGNTFCYYDEYPISNSYHSDDFICDYESGFVQAIDFSLLTDANVTVKITNARGREVTRGTRMYDKGTNKFQWNLTNEEYSEAITWGWYGYEITTSPAALFSSHTYWGLKEEQVTFINKTHDDDNINGQLRVYGFGDIPSGDKVWLLWNEDYTVKTKDEYINTDKHHHWNNDVTKYKLTKNFVVEFRGDQNAYFTEPVTVHLSSNSPYAVEIQDPWFVRDDGTQTGEEWVEAEDQNQIFLNQEYDPNNPDKPIYRLRAPSEFGSAPLVDEYVFKAWRAYEPDGVTPDVNGNYAVIEDSTNHASCAVVFKAPGAVVKAVYKAPFEIPGYNYVVNSNESLTIPAGEEISFAEGFTLDIRGELHVNGTPEAPVRLTGSGREAVFDNGGNLRPPDPSDTLIVVSASAGAVTLSNTVIENTYCALAVEDHYDPNLILQEVEIAHSNIGILIGKTEGDWPQTNPRLIFSGLNLHDSHNGIVFGPGLADTDQTTDVWLHRSTLWNIAGDGVFIFQEEPIADGSASVLNVYLYNNTFYNHGRYGVYCYNEAGNDWAQVNFTVYNNIFVTSPFVTTSNLVDVGSATNLSTSTGNIPPNTTVADPLLTDPEQGDFHLTASSPAIDAGTGYTDPFTPLYFTDPDGTPPDIGVYYYDAVPSVPTGLVLSGQLLQPVELDWNANPEPDIDHYNVYRSMEGMGYTKIAAVSGTHFEDPHVRIGTWKDFEYCYKVSAVDWIEQESTRSSAECIQGQGPLRVAALPQVFALHPAYPNPFNPKTTLRYDLPEKSRVSLTIFNLKGQIIRTLIAGQQTAGYKKVLWDGANKRGQAVPSGMYLYTFEAEGFNSGNRFQGQGKLVLMK